MTVSLRVTYDRILVKPDADLRKTASGIFLPTSEEGKVLLRGTVTAVGSPGRALPDGSYAPLRTSEGDTIWFRRDVAVPFVGSDGEVLLIMKDGDALMIEEGSDHQLYGIPAEEEIPDVAV